MKKIKLFLRRLIKTQFLLKHIFVFIIIPIILSFCISLKFTYFGTDKQFLSGIITIVGITGGLLLNFLAIVLTSNSTILTSEKNKYKEKHIYGTINIGTKKIPNIKKINFYYFMYYRIFFLIFMSLFFIIVHIFSYIGVLDLVNYLDGKINDYILFCSLLKSTILFVYLYLLILYFLLLSHLIYRIYYLFHSSE